MLPVNLSESMFRQRLENSCKFLSYNFKNMSEIKNIIVEFDVNISQLETLKSQATLVDRSDIDSVKETVKMLVKTRRAIEAKGKEYRDEANAFNKSVIAKEKEYISVIEPLEVELKEVIEKDNERKIIEARRELLPNRMRHISILKIATIPTEDEILQLDDAQWATLYDQLVAEHEKAIEVAEKKEQDEKDRAAREENIAKEAAEKATHDAEEKAKRTEKERLEKEAAENARLEAEAEYRAFLEKNNFNKGTDIIKKEGNSVKIYRYVAEFVVNL